MTDSPPAPPNDAEQRSARRAAGTRRRITGWFRWLHAWAESGWSREAVAGWGVLNSSVVPGPSEVLFAPLALADPERAYELAAWAIAGNVAGGAIAYAIGALAFPQIGEPVLAMLGIGAPQVVHVRALFAAYGWLVVALAGLPIFSTKLISIAAGAFGVPLPLFTVTLLATRGARFMVVAWLCRVAGARVERWLM